MRYQDKSRKEKRQGRSSAQRSKDRTRIQSKRMGMATAKEVKEHLKIALAEIGKIEPWFDKEVDAWVFGHPCYPVEYAGSSKAEVIKNYPLYLADFIEERLKNNLAPLTEKKTKGRGGKREGAGRPKGTKKELTRRVYLPVDVANWFDKPGAISEFRQFVANEDRSE